MTGFWSGYRAGPYGHDCKGNWPSWIEPGALPQQNHILDKQIHTLKTILKPDKMILPVILATLEVKSRRIKV
jgi:hypothetical protein